LVFRRHDWYRAVCDSNWLALTGLLNIPLDQHVGVHRVIAAAIALALTAGLCIAGKAADLCPHPRW